MKRKWIIGIVGAALIFTLVANAISNSNSGAAKTEVAPKHSTESTIAHSMQLSQAVDSLMYSHRDDQLWVIAKGRDGDKTRHLLNCDVQKSVSRTLFSAPSKVPFFGIALSPSDEFVYTAQWRNAPGKRAEVLELDVRDGTTKRKLLASPLDDLNLRHTSDPVVLGISPNGEYIAVGSKLVDDERIAGGHIGGEVCVWNLKSGNVLWNNKTVHTGIPRSVVFTADSETILSAGEDSLIRIWQASTGKLLDTLVGTLSGGVNSMALSRDGRFLATGGAGQEEGGCVRVWDLKSKSLLRVVRPFAGNTFVHVTFCPNGVLVAAGAKATDNDKPPEFELQAWSNETFSRLGVIGNGKGIVRAITSSNSSQKVAVGTWEKEILEFKFEKLN